MTSSRYVMCLVKCSDHLKLFSNRLADLNKGLSSGIVMVLQNSCACI